MVSACSAPYDLVNCGAIRIFIDVHSLGGMMDKLTTKLLTHQNECTISWITRDGSPASTVVSFIWEDDAIWMTALSASARVGAIRRDPRISVVVSGKGCKVGDTRCVSMRGRCEILDSAEIRDWFFPRFSRKVLHKSRMGASMMAKAMNSPGNLVLKFTPEKTIPYDARRAMQAANFLP
ncbi:Uncharacterised protein [BD1-7 clade bacterium]|uniref:Pyridoxamine 5'-phosphate oxidase N-terminal domain-containing protein n=1 Tax=BD1-7 clade bacterium TaxID=2029982 RepID=A0A5S9QZJ6_9GAMM|nr:Uncharacterised protein [BD1-7 clade bacterium]